MWVRAATVQLTDCFSYSVWKEVRKREALFICSAVNINLRNFLRLGSKEEAVSSQEKNSL